MDMKSKIPETVRKGSADVRKRLAALDNQQPHAVLATASGNEPYTSLIAYALTDDLTGLLFATPKDTRKYRSMMKNNHVSLLIDTRTNTPGDYMNGESITILGTARSIRKGTRRDELATVFLNKHPKLKEFVSAPSTALMLVTIRRCVHVSSFQVVSEISMDR